VILAAGSLPPFVLVTSNAGKRREAERILGFSIETVEVDLPEIQSLDMAEVLRAKADEAWSQLRRPLIVEETGLEIHAMNGFPGPLVKWMLEAVGAEGVARVASAFEYQAATARCSLLYRSAEGDVVASGQTVGGLVLPPRGGQGFGWDPVFLPEGESRTYGELSTDRKDEIGHRGRAWRALVAKLLQSVG
jgi:non-canonical purine NTP pyrophosphatase (RdgB/HAM1 family)